MSAVAWVIHGLYELIYLFIALILPLSVNLSLHFFRYIFMCARWLCTFLNSTKRCYLFSFYIYLLLLFLLCSNWFGLTFLASFNVLSHQLAGTCEASSTKTIWVTGATEKKCSRVQSVWTGMELVPFYPVENGQLARYQKAILTNSA